MVGNSGAILNQQIGIKGGAVIADTSPHTVNFGHIIIITDTVISAITSNITGLASATLTLPAGLSFPCRGSAITLTSGKIILYNK